MIDTVIVSAKIVTPRGIIYGPIAIDSGRIEVIGPEWQMPKSLEVIDAKERFVIPGLVDPHVHYGLIPEPGKPFADACKRDWKPDSIGAAFGGVTTVMPMLMSHASYLPITRDLIGDGLRHDGDRSQRTAYGRHG